MGLQSLKNFVAMCAWLTLVTATLAHVDTAYADDDTLFGSAETLELGSLVLAVLERNPSIEAARSAWRAAAAVPAQAGAFDDPMVGYSLAPQSIDVADMRYGQVVEVGQKIPFFGKRGFRAAAADAEARAAEGNYETTRRDIARMAAMVYSEYYAAYRAVEINGQHGRILADMLASAKASYVSGQIPQYALVRVELQRVHILHDEAEMRTDADIARSALNALLHRAPSADLPPPPREIRARDLIVPAPEEFDAVLATRPEMASAKARIEAAKANVALARREFFPDFTVGAEYNSMWADEKHRSMVGVRVDLPLQIGRRRAALDGAEAEAGSRRAELAALIDSIGHQIESAKHRYHEAEHVTALYRDQLLPAARDAIASTRTAFMSATAEFGEMIDAEHELRDIELQYEKSIAQLVQRRAELEWSFGRVPGVEP